MRTPRDRLRRVLEAARLEVADEPERQSSYSHEVWATEQYVVRLNTRPALRRLHREVATSRLLPDAVPYPEVVSVGIDDQLEWVITRRLPGKNLCRAWPLLALDVRRQAIRELATILRALHAIQLPAEFEAQAAGPGGAIAESAIETNIHLLPLDRLLRHIERARELPNVDARAMDALAARVASAPDPFAAGEPQCLVHCDAHFENLLWHDGHITALLDFEWARRGPRDLELEVLLRWCAYPWLLVAREEDEAFARPELYADVPAWLREDDPELFEHPRLHERLELYAFAYDVRQLHLFPPAGPPDALPRLHPYRRILASLDGSGHLERLRW